MTLDSNSNAVQMVETRKSGYVRGNWSLNYASFRRDPSRVPENKYLSQVYFYIVIVSEVNMYL